MPRAAVFTRALAVLLVALTSLRDIKGVRFREWVANCCLRMIPLPSRRL